MRNKILILMLVLSMPVSVAAKNYKGAEYRTKESFLYGRFEVSMKTAGKEGMLASFFTYHELGSGGTSEWNEIDIEVMGRFNNSVQFNTITPGQTNHVRAHLVDFDPSVDYHTYAFEWTPDYVAWFIDGAEVYRQTGEHIKTLTRSQKLMMNVWNPAYANWAGEWSDAILPAFSYYDWTAYYTYEKGAGNYGTDNNFKFSWKDDFDSWDTSRWDKATHTWDGNNCDFMKENAVFDNSKLVLCLTDNVNLGLYDKSAPVLLWVRGHSNKIHAFFSEQLDKSSAENPDNYLIPGLQISKVELLGDQRTVEITVGELAPGSTPNLIIKGGIKDKAAVPNTMGLVAKIVVVSPVLEFPVKINLGAQSALGGFMKDQNWGQSGEFGYMDGSAGTNQNSIANADDERIYQTERYGLVKYFVRVPDGQYNVKLLFAENYFTAAGKRVFDVYLQGKQVLDNLDIFAAAGARTALVKEFSNIEVTDGIMEFHFSSEVENPVINGIVIEKVATGVGDTKEIPFNYKLEQNYPNPFNPRTVIRYEIPRNEKVTIKVFDISGRLISTLLNDEMPAGSHEIDFSPVGISSGIYLCSFRAGSYSEFNKMVYLK